MPAIDQLAAGLHDVAAGRGVCVIFATPEQLAAVLAALAPASPPPPAPPAARQAPAQRSAVIAPEPGGLEAEILDLLARNSPLKGSTIARRLRRNFSYVRRVLAKLKRTGQVEHADDGYRLA